jgi:ABC-2 type transport system permease protein
VTATRAVGAQAKTELVLTLRRGESLIVTLAIPLGVLVFFSKIDTTITPAGYRDPVDFLVPGVLALAVMSTAMVSLGIATGFERRYGVLKRLGTTPLSRAGLLAAKTATVLAMEALQFVLIVAVGAALGWHATVAIVPAVGVMLLGTVAFAGLGLLLAGTLRAEATLALANGLFLVLLFLGGMAYPLERLPAFLRDVAHALPAAALSECLRGLLAPGKAFPTGSLGVLIVWAVALPWLAARRFRWEE